MLLKIGEDYLIFGIMANKLKQNGDPKVSVAVVATACAVTSWEQ
jgi:hypothetical protein